MYVICTYYIIIGIAITRDNQLIADNILPDYSYINALVTSTDVIIASCVTGLGPSGSDDNNALGGLYFNENSIPNGVCNSSVIQPNGRAVNSFVGVINMFQCGTFTVTGEGVYTCTMMNSTMMYQSTRLGIYFIGRSKSLLCKYVFVHIVRIYICVCTTYLNTTL